MNKENLYIVVQWPESQDFIGRANCHLIDENEGYNKYGSSAYFVRLDIYEQVTNLPYTPDYGN